MKNLCVMSLLLMTTPIFAGTPGTIKWIARMNAPIVASTTLSADQQTLYVGSTNNQLIALNTSNGTETWHYIFRGGVYSAPAYDAKNNVVYVTTNAILSSEIGGIYALQGSTGSLLGYSQSFQPADNTYRFGKPILANTVVFSYSYRTVLCSVISPSNNALQIGILGFSLDKNPPSSIFYFIVNNLSLDPSKFDLYRKWEIVLDGISNPESSPPGVVFGGEGIVTPLFSVDGIGSIDDLYQTLRSPLLRWKGALYPSLNFSFPVHDSDRGMIYVGGSDQALYAYDPHSATGTNVSPIWVLHLSGDLSQNPPAVGFNGSGPAAIYETSSNGYLYAISVMQAKNGRTQAGALKWGIHLSDAGFATQPTVAGTTGGVPIIYVTDKTGNVYAVLDEGQSGQVEPWGNPIRGGVMQVSAPATIGEDGSNQIIYLSNNQSPGLVYAVYGPAG